MAQTFFYPFFRENFNIFRDLSRLHFPSPSVIILTMNRASNSFALVNVADVRSGSGSHSFFILFLLSYPSPVAGVDPPPRRFFTCFGSVSTPQQRKKRQTHFCIWRLRVSTMSTPSRKNASIFPKFAARLCAFPSGKHLRAEKRKK